MAHRSMCITLWCSAVWQVFTWSARHPLLHLDPLWSGRGFASGSRTANQTNPQQRELASTRRTTLRPADGHRPYTQPAWRRYGAGLTPMMQLLRHLTAACAFKLTSEGMPGGGRERRKPPQAGALALMWVHFFPLIQLVFLVISQWHAAWFVYSCWASYCWEGGGFNSPPPLRLRGHLKSPEGSLSPVWPHTRGKQPQVQWVWPPNSVSRDDQWGENDKHDHHTSQK